MEDNISEFNNVVALVFSQLYDSFPSPCGIIAHELVGGEMDEYELRVCSKTRNAIDTIYWLKSEGFIKGEGGNLGIFHSCIFTAKGLAALNSVPESIGGKEPLITKIKSALKSGSNESTKAAVSAVIKEAVSNIF